MDLNVKAKPEAPADDPADHVLRSMVVLLVLSCGTVGAAVTAWVRDSADWLVVSTVGLACASCALLVYKLIAAVVFIVRGSGLDIVDEAVDVAFDQIHELHQRHGHGGHDAKGAESLPDMDAKAMRERFAKAARAAASQRK
jgi:hypothetical protein